MSIQKYTGQELIEVGCQQDPLIGELLHIVNAAPHTRDEVIALIKARSPEPAVPLLSQPAPCQHNITASIEDEVANPAAV